MVEPLTELSTTLVDEASQVISGNCCIFRNVYINRIIDNSKFSFQFNRLYFH